MAWNQWVSEQIQNQIDEEGNDENITEDEINMSRDVKERYIYKSHNYLFYKHCWHYWLFNNACIVVFSSWTKTNGWIHLRRYPTVWEYGWH